MGLCCSCSSGLGGHHHCCYNFVSQTERASIVIIAGTCHVLAAVHPRRVRKRRMIPLPKDLSPLEDAGLLPREVPSDGRGSFVVKHRICRWPTIDSVDDGLLHCSSRTTHFSRCVTTIIAIEYAKLPHPREHTLRASKAATLYRGSEHAESATVLCRSPRRLDRSRCAVRMIVRYYRKGDST